MSDVLLPRYYNQYLVVGSGSRQFTKSHYYYVISNPNESPFGIILRTKKNAQLLWIFGTNMGIFTRKKHPQARGIFRSKNLHRNLFLDSQFLFKFILGHTRQGLKCKLCRMNVHPDCQIDAGKCTPKSRLLRRQKSASELDSRVLPGMEDDSKFFYF